MINAAFKALGDLLSPEFRAVLLKAIGLSLLLFVLLFGAMQLVLWFLALVPWPWLDTLISIGASLSALVAFFFLMAPVTALFAGFFLDRIAEKVERKHYPEDPVGTELSVMTAAWLGVQFGIVVLVINIVALPFVFTGIGAVVLIVINAYLLSREYFEMVGRRHMTPDAAKDFRKNNAMAVFMAGILPALFSLVPLLNLTVPLFSTSYFTHLFKRLRRS